MCKFTNGETVYYMVDGKSYTAGVYFESNDPKHPHLYNLAGTHLVVPENLLTKDKDVTTYQRFIED